ncbi:hypothetical protein TNCV_2160661 [Trichonephila clavipes]|nr:hypothetical protein TNCV_2160661 [Trichonephila clavipes]
MAGRIMTDPPACLTVGRRRSLSYTCAGVLQKCTRLLKCETRFARPYYFLPLINQPEIKLRRPSRPKPTNVDSSVSRDESSHSDGSSVMDFMPSTKELENKDIECIFCNGKLPEDQRREI